MKEVILRVKPMIVNIFRKLKKWISRYPLLVRWSIYISSTLALALVLFVGLVWSGLFGRIANVTELKSINHQVATEVYSADSVLLGRYYLQERLMIPSSQIPEGLKKALIATEDARFYTHNGIDTKSLFRVLFKSILLQKESAGGGSTLTQQLAKNLYPRRSYAMFSLPINKVKEMILARRLERAYSKDELLVLYLNTIPFGDNVYGIKTASERFFSKPVSELSIEESAVLIGMLKATHSYNPRLYPERALQRRNVVIAQMSKYDFITDQEKTSLQAKPLNLNYKRLTHNGGLAPYFRSYIKPELMEWCRQHEKADGTHYNIYTDGLKVYTTIDSRLQRFAEEAVRKEMEIIQKKFASQTSKNLLIQIANSKISQLPAYKRLKAQGRSEKEILTELKEPSLKRVFDYKGAREMKISTYDSLIRHIQFLQAGLLASDPATGAVRAWVGGIDHEFFQYDHVRESTKRQVGSTFKPIVYAAALEEGANPCDYVSARKTSYTNMEDWTPENTEDETYDQKYSMEGGLAGSVNTVSVKMLEKAGIANTIRIAEKMGIKSDLPAVPSLALGTASVSILEMVNAYGVFANRGRYVEPIYITSITDNKGKVLEDFQHETKPLVALSKETSDMMIHMLKRVVNEGTGAGLRSRFGLTNDIAGKTGTTQSNTDGWFIGITPRMVVGAWVGGDDPRIHFKSTALGQGASTALPIVGRFMQQMNREKEFDDIASAKFQTLSPALMSKLDCELSRSDRNLLERIFGRKKDTKQVQFGDSKAEKKKERRKKRRQRN